MSRGGFTGHTSYPQDGISPRHRAAQHWWVAEGWCPWVELMGVLDPTDWVRLHEGKVVPELSTQGLNTFSILGVCAEADAMQGAPMCA